MIIRKHTKWCIWWLFSVTVSAKVKTNHCSAIIHLFFTKYFENFMAAYYPQNDIV